MKKLLCLILSLLCIAGMVSCGKKNELPLLCGVCGSPDHVTHPPVITRCSVCGGNHAVHEYCTNCDSYSHSTENCTFKATEICEYCAGGHASEDHPKCDKCSAWTHGTDNCPEINNNAVLVCEKCKSKFHITKNHAVCSYCGNPNHSDADHPVCGHCNKQHKESENKCPFICKFCDSLEHTSDKHPRCGYCNVQGHSTENHPSCSVCNKKHGESDENCPNKPKAPKDTNNNDDSCDICGSDHKTQNHPVCNNCGNKHIEDDSKCPYAEFCSKCGEYGHDVKDCPKNNQEKDESDGDDTQQNTPYCKNCKTYDHETDDCPNVPCGICGNESHTEDTHPVCSNCNEKHAESEENCPKNNQGKDESDGDDTQQVTPPYCKNCKTYTDHETENCPYVGCDICGNKSHTEDTHPACSNCNEKHAESEENCPKPKNVSEQEESTEDNTPPNSITCGWCYDTTHNTQECPIFNEGGLCRSCGANFLDGEHEPDCPFN